MVGLHIRSILDNGPEYHLLDKAREQGNVLYPGAKIEGVVNFFDPKAVDWWWENGVMKVASIGAKFVKTDVGGTMDLKGLHNIFPLAYAEAPYRKFQEYNNMRGVTHTREGYAGIQRYPYIWAGDWGSEWQWFEPVIRAGLNIGMSGVGNWTHCMGGFEQYSPYDTELYTRWVQFGMFSPIAQGVQNSMESRKQHVAGEEWKMGAGDQGVMTGYACSETKQFLPLPVVLAHRIVRELSACRISEYIRGLLPDGKAQITVEYEDGKPVRLDTVIVSCQHAEEKSQKDLEREIRQKVLRPALRLLPPDEDTRILINPSGKFVVGGLDADTGLTGRKLMVDCYGSIAPHGGGAFSGKDATKVDRSGAYMARYIAKNMVAAGLAEKCWFRLLMQLVWQNL